MLLEELEPDRALARDHGVVLERMDQRRAGPLDVLERCLHRLLEDRADELDVRAVVARRVDLRHRRVLRHEDRRVGPLLAGRVRDGLAVVPGARRDDAGGPLLVGQHRDLVDRATDLERACPLEVLRLQQDLPAAQPRERLRAEERRDTRVVADPLARILDVSECRGCPLGRHRRERPCP